MQRLSWFPSILQLKKVPLIALFLCRERCNNFTTQSRICCSSSVFFFSLSLSGHGGEWEHKNVSVYAQNYQMLLLFPSCLPQPVIATNSPPRHFLCHRILLSAWCACLTPPIKAIIQNNTSCTSVVILVLKKSSFPWALVHLSTSHKWKKKHKKKWIYVLLYVWCSLWLSLSRDFSGQCMESMNI